MLTIKKIDAAQPGARDYKLADRDGLYLFVGTTGLKSWRANYSADGKQKTRTYGRYPAMTLNDARMQHDTARHAVAVAKAEPVAPSAPTFDSIMEKWLAKHLSTLKNEKHRQQYRATLERWACPTIGKRPIDSIKRKELVDLVQSIQKPDVTGKQDDRAETAHRVAGRITAVFNFAQDIGELESHPAGNLTRVLMTRAVKKPMACVAPERAGELVRSISSYAEGNNEGVITRLALRFAALTVARVNEIRLMEWTELEEDGAVWVAPEEHVKGTKDEGTPHVVPLSQQARAVLEEVRRYTGECRYVFESSARPGYPMSENTLLFALYRLGYRDEMTVHGFRALFSTVANQSWPSDGTADKRDVIEKQLNHGESNEVRAAYNRAMYLPQRRVLMQWYADWLDTQAATR